MTAIAYPTHVRKWNPTKPLNSASNDFHTEQGIRVSQPIYIDIPNTLRKELLNAVRTAASQQLEVEETVQKISNIRTVSSSTRQPEIEEYLGMNLDVLRTVLFSRGGLQADLVFRLQQVTGLQFITAKDVKAAFKLRQNQLLGYLEEVANEPESV
jgi:hypothetical protein